MPSEWATKRAATLSDSLIPVELSADDEHKIALSLDAAREDGRREERAAITRWLRDAETGTECDGRHHRDGGRCVVLRPLDGPEAADIIERGGHVAGRKA